MKVLAASVDYFDDRCSNSPTIKILVDRLPESDTLRWRRWPTQPAPDGGTTGYCYVGVSPEAPEYHRYFLGDPEKPGTGFGGTRSVVTMETGDQHTIIGAWSGRPCVVLSSTGIGLCDVAIACRDGRYPGIYCTGSFPPRFVAEALTMAPTPAPFESRLYGWALAKPDPARFHYEPVLVKGRESAGTLLHAE